MIFFDSFPVRMTVAAFLAGPLLVAHAQSAAASLPPAWSDVDKTLAYEVALAGALHKRDLAPLRTAQQEIAAEGTPTHRRLMARLNDLSRDPAMAFKMGPCEYAAVLVRGMALQAHEAAVNGKPAATPTDEQVAQYAEQIGRCERLGRRTPSTRLLGAE